MVSEHVFPIFSLSALIVEYDKHLEEMREQLRIYEVCMLPTFCTLLVLYCINM